jgi:hydrogenase maturation protein HypF
VAAGGKERLHIVLRGEVQGIGFRPTIYSIAQKLHLAGWVRDNDAAIEMEVEGDREQLATFLDRLNSNRPQAAVVTLQQVIRIVPQHSTWFEILPSEPREAAPAAAAVSAD